jgi:hypothetical protein
MYHHYNNNAAFYGGFHATATNNTTITTHYAWNGSNGQALTGRTGMVGHGAGLSAVGPLSASNFSSSKATTAAVAVVANSNDDLMEYEESDVQFMDNEQSDVQNMGRRP